MAPRYAGLPAMRSDQICRLACRGHGVSEGQIAAEITRASGLLLLLVRLNARARWVPTRATSLSFGTAALLRQDPAL